MENLFFNPNSLPSYVMAKPAGSLCNLNCQYCYYLEKEKLYKGRKTFQMGEYILEKYIESYINSQPIPDVCFTWHGGESLLRDQAFYQKALKLQRIYGRGRNIRNSIQTNGTLITDSWCRFFRENNFLVGISIDGPEHCHNKYRKNKRGEGTFYNVMQAIEKLHRYQVEFNTLSVINDYTAQFPLEIYNFFKTIGSRYMQFSPVVERFTTDRPDGLALSSSDDKDGVTLTPWSVAPEQFGQFYITLFDEWVRKDVGAFFVQLFDATLAATVGYPPGVCLFAETCGHAAAMEFNGDVYSCDHYVFPEHRLGNIKDKTIYEMMSSPQQLDFAKRKKEHLPESCKACKFLTLCRGECPKNRFIWEDGEKYPVNYLCSGYKAYFRHVEPYMNEMARQLANEQPPANIMKQF